MQEIIYYDFTPTGNYTGVISEGINTNIVIETVGNLSQPGDSIKLASGTNAWVQDPQNISFLSGDLIINKVENIQWDTPLKEKWLRSYLKHVNLEDITNSDFNIIVQLAENINLFESLSGPCIAYVNKNVITDEISIGMNVYHLPFVLNYAFTLPVNNTFRQYVLTNHIQTPVYVSNVAYVEYGGYGEVVWCFSGTIYNYTIPENAVYDLHTGGGFIFSEVKLAGSEIQASYIVKKNIDENDPSFGLYSGESEPFCQGDDIYLIDTSTWTSFESGTNGNTWTWIGDFTVLNYTWHIADVTDACENYRNVPISEMKFPMRVIQFCKFEDFD
jgi:hypothetical protein